jgi:hypothetical protein
MKCCREEYPLDGQPCQGEVDEYYGTDGGLANLCEYHMKQCRHLVWDDGYPMSKKYSDEVYEPSLDFEYEAHSKICSEHVNSKGEFDHQSLKDWCQTDEGKARLADVAQKNKDNLKKLREAAYPLGKKKWWGWDH